MTQFPFSYYIHKLFKLPIKSDMREPLDNLKDILSLDPYKFICFLDFFASGIIRFLKYKDSLEKHYRYQAKLECEEYCRQYYYEYGIEPDFEFKIDPNLEYEMDISIYNPNAEAFSSALSIALDSSRFYEFVRHSQEFYYPLDTRGGRHDNYNNRVIIKNIINFFAAAYREHSEQINYWLKQDFQAGMFALLRRYKVYNFKVMLINGQNCLIKIVPFEEIDFLITDFFQSINEQKPNILNIFDHLLDASVEFRDVDLENRYIRLHPLSSRTLKTEPTHQLYTQLCLDFSSNLLIEEYGNEYNSSSSEDKQTLLR